jgi:hypothetical protein
MASKHGLKTKMQQAIRKRRAAPRPKPLELGEVSRGRRTQLTEGHQDVLQNIEFSIADLSLGNPELDDLIVHQTLRASMLHSDPAEPLAHQLYVRLEMARSMRDDVEPEVWHDALRVVAESVRTHSSLAPGEQGYLEFILPYLAPALDLADGSTEIDAELEDDPADDADYRVIEGYVVRTRVDSFDPTRNLLPPPAEK